MKAHLVVLGIGLDVVCGLLVTLMLRAGRAARPGAVQGQFWRAALHLAMPRVVILTALVWVASFTVFSIVKINIIFLIAILLSLGGALSAILIAITVSLFVLNLVAALVLTLARARSVTTWVLGLSWIPFVVFVLPAWASWRAHGMLAPMWEWQWVLLWSGIAIPAELCWLWLSWKDVKSRTERRIVCPA